MENESSREIPEHGGGIVLSLAWSFSGEKAVEKAYHSWVIGVRRELDIHLLQTPYFIIEKL